MNAARKLFMRKLQSDKRVLGEDKEKPLFDRNRKITNRDTGSRVEGKCQLCFFGTKKKKNLKRK